MIMHDTFYCRIQVLLKTKAGYLSSLSDFMITPFQCMNWWSSKIQAKADFVLSFVMTWGTHCYRNAGIIGGRFLENTRVPKPGSHPDRPDYYGPKDFIIGSTVEIFKHKFTITEADLYVLKYMEARPAEFSNEIIEALRHKLISDGKA